MVKRKVPKFFKSTEAVEYFRDIGARGGAVGGKRSLETMTKKERKERAIKAANARWAKKRKENE